MKKCSISNCESPSRKRGWCSHHYDRWWRSGHPERLRQAGKKRNPSIGFFQHEWLDAISAYDGDECLFWPWKARDGDGYPLFSLNGKSHRAHRYVCSLVNGLPPTPLHQAAHSCGKGHLGCVAPSHLRWATCLQNQRDRALHGTKNIGSKNPNSKLNENIVAEIRTLWDSGSYDYRQIANQFGISSSAARAVVLGETWTSVRSEAA